MIKKISSFVRDNFLLIFSAFFFILWLIYRTPEEQATSLINNFNLNFQTSYDFMSPFVWIFYVIAVFVVSDSFFINQKAYYSDYVFMNGLKRNKSCTGSSIYHQISGGMGYLRTEGIKMIPIEGNYVLIAPISHIYLIGTNIIIEAKGAEDMPLSYIPYDLKLTLWKLRKGFFGLTECTVGYLSPKELEQKEFKGNDFEEDIDSEDKNKIFNTAGFIEAMHNLNNTHNYMFEIANKEHSGYSEFLDNTSSIGLNIFQKRNQSILSKVVNK